MFREFVIGNRESSVVQATPQVLRTGPFIARPVERFKADEGSRQSDGIGSVIHELIRLRPMYGDRPDTLRITSGANQSGRADGITLGNDKPKYRKAREQ